MTATQFRRQIYQVLSDLARSGGQATVTHRDRTFFIVPKARPALMDRLVSHDTLRVHADNLIAAESPAWEWSEDRNIDGLS